MKAVKEGPLKIVFENSLNSQAEVTGNITFAK
jgi:hypothetical protein